MTRPSKSLSIAVWRCVQRLVRRLSAWVLRDELSLQQNVNEDAQALVDALLRGERADAYCGYGRDGQASNYRDELKWSLHELQKANADVSHQGRGGKKSSFANIPGWRKDTLGWPIETFNGKPVKSAIRIICQNIRKVICKPND